MSNELRETGHQSSHFVADPRPQIAVLIHDNKGRFLPSLVCAILRLVCDWTLDGALNEYRRFMPSTEDWIRDDPAKVSKKRDKERLADIQVRSSHPRDGPVVSSRAQITCLYLAADRSLPSRDAHVRPSLCADLAQEARGRSRGLDARKSLSLSRGVHLLPLRCSPRRPAVSGVGERRSNKPSVERTCEIRRLKLQPSAVRCRQKLS